VDHELVEADDIASLKSAILGAGLEASHLIYTAWSSASTFRGSDRRGGANGARIRLDPMRSWEVNQPGKLAKALEVYETIQSEFNDAQAGGKRVSLADLIVLGGCAAVEAAARAAGVEVSVPFTPGRMDASQAQTDVESVQYLEPLADGFRNYLAHDYTLSPEELLVDKAQLLTLSAPEMTALLGGLRVLDANYRKSKAGVLTDRPGALTNDFFVNLLDMGTEWTPTSDDELEFEGRDRETGDLAWTATRVDLVFGSNSQLRGIAEVYGADDAHEPFVHDFVRAWDKVMMLDRFDV
jgi:catalase-peroxidase